MYSFKYVSSYQAAEGGAGQGEPVKKESSSKKKEKDADDYWLYPSKKQKEKKKAQVCSWTSDGNCSVPTIMYCA